MIENEGNRKVRNGNEKTKGESREKENSGYEEMQTCKEEQIDERRLKEKQQKDRKDKYSEK